MFSPKKSILFSPYHAVLLLFASMIIFASAFFILCRPSFSCCRLASVVVYGYIIARCFPVVKCFYYTIQNIFLHHASASRASWTTPGHQRQPEPYRITPAERQRTPRQHSSRSSRKRSAPAGQDQTPKRKISDLRQEKTGSR